MVVVMALFVHLRSMRNATAGRTKTRLRQFAMYLVLFASPSMKDMRSNTLYVSTMT